MDEDLVIDASNFGEYFFDVRMHTPRKGQVMARYTAIAEFISGPEKQQMIDLLHMPEKARPAVQVMRKLLFANERDAFRVPREMVEDLTKGMSIQEVLDKPYRYTLEYFYYVDPQHVPEGDPHWCKIPLLYKGVEDSEDSK